MIEDRDFVGLGLAEHVQQKIFTNLVLRGFVQADGGIIESRLPQSEDGFALAGNFDADGETVFELIGGLCQEADGDDVAVVPSDLESLETLSPDEQAELYDNLIFNRYLDTDGTVLWTDFFLDPENAADFWVNADLGAAGPAVWRHLRERVAAFDTTRSRWTRRSSRICGCPQLTSTAWSRTCASTATSTRAAAMSTSGRCSR